MSQETPFRDGIGRLAQAGAAAGVMLVRITAIEEHNRYTARAIEFDADGHTQFATDRTVTVTNLAEPADAPGEVPAGTEAVAVDVEGRWVIFIRRTPAAFFARIVSSQGGAAYTVREQVATGPGQFQDKDGAGDITAHNLAELSLGPGGAVDEEAIVVVHSATDTGQPPATRYIFDHPAYAKYLD